MNDQLCIVCKDRPAAINPATGKQGKLCAECALKAIAEFCGFEASFLLNAQSCQDAAQSFYERRATTLAASAPNETLQAWELRNDISDTQTV